jgi:hypothetical protein
MAKRAGQHEEEPDTKENGDAAGVLGVGPLSIVVEADGVVPANKGKDSNELQVLDHVDS